jgi:RNA polymerase sigma factor (sigma-70 family)
MSAAITFGEKAYHLMYAKVMREFHGDSDCAHDSATEVWIAAARKVPAAFVGESDLIGYCLFKCVRMAIDLKRKWRAISGRERLLTAIPVDENEHIREHARHELALAVAGLPDLDRQIISLYYYEGFSDRAIAAYLLGDSGCSDARRKAIFRKRQIAENLLRLFFAKSGLDYVETVAAFAGVIDRPWSS